METRKAYPLTTEFTTRQVKALTWFQEHYDPVVNPTDGNVINLYSKGDRKFEFGFNNWDDAIDYAEERYNAKSKGSN